MLRSNSPLLRSKRTPGCWISRGDSVQISRMESLALDVERRLNEMEHFDCLFVEGASETQHVAVIVLNLEGS